MTEQEIARINQQQNLAGTPNELFMVSGPSGKPVVMTARNLKKVKGFRKYDGQAPKITALGDTLMEELSAKDKEIEALKAQLAAKPKRGRPKKQQTE